MSTARGAVEDVAGALRAAGLTTHTLPDTPVVGPCAVVGIPTVTSQDGVCDRFTYEVPVLLVGPGELARVQLLDLIDTALAAMTAARLPVTGDTQLLEQGLDAQLTAYQLTVTID